MPTDVMWESRNRSLCGLFSVSDARRLSPIVRGTNPERGRRRTPPPLLNVHTLRSLYRAPGVAAAASGNKA
jgi:hypothetical protein